MRRFFLRKQKKRSATERAKDALHSSESGGGLCGYGWQAARFAIRRFFLRKQKEEPSNCEGCRGVEERQLPKPGNAAQIYSDFLPRLFSQ